MDNRPVQRTMCSQLVAVPAAPAVHCYFDSARLDTFPARTEVSRDLSATGAHVAELPIDHFLRCSRGISNSRPANCDPKLALPIRRDLPHRRAPLALFISSFSPVFLLAPTCAGTFSRAPSFVSNYSVDYSRNAGSAFTLPALSLSC